MKKLLAAVLASAFAAPAFAQAVTFESVDADQSGTISLAELQAVVPNVNEETFRAIDTDGSGELSPEEFAAISGG